jgi:hypothetical protein
MKGDYYLQGKIAKASYPKDYYSEDTIMKEVLMTTFTMCR